MNDELDHIRLESITLGNCTLACDQYTIERNVLIMKSINDIDND